MNRDQFNRTGMFNTVSAYMAQNNVIWSAVSAVTETVGELDTAIGAIAEKAGKQQTPHRWRRGRKVGGAAQP